MLRILLPDGTDPFWITPGGGLLPNESAEQGLRRELNEELGLSDFQIGPLVWKRQHTFDWKGERIQQTEDYFIVHVERFDPQMTDVVELEVLDRFQWWTVEQLQCSSERLTPVSLPDIVYRYLSSGPPDDIPEMEILVD